MRSLCLLLCLAAWGQEKTEYERVREIVEKIIVPAKVPGLPDRLLITRHLMAEEAALAVGKLVDEEAGRDDEIEGEAPAAAPARRIAIASQCFDMWVFGNVSDARARNAWLEKRLEGKLRHMGLLHRLDESQLRRLHLAGRGDIKRFFVEIEARRREFEAIRHDIRRAQVALHGLAPVSARFDSGPFGEDTLFAKTLAKILDDRKAESTK